MVFRTFNDPEHGFEGRLGVGSKSAYDRQFPKEDGDGGDLLSQFIITKKSIAPKLQEVPDRLDDTELAELLKSIQQQRADVAAGTKTWQDYYATLKDNEGWQKTFIQNNDLATASVEDLKKANESAIKIVQDNNTALKNMTISAKAASVASKAIAFIGNAAMSVSVSALVQWAATGVAKLIELAQSSDEAFKKAQAFGDSMQKSSREFSDNSQKVAELNERYQELSQGVTAAGENISLTDAQYIEYKNIISELHDIMPNLTTRLNEQGEAIGFVKGQLEDANKEYEKYFKGQAARQWVEGDENGNKPEDVWKGYERLFKHGKLESWFDVLEQGFGNGWDIEDVPTAIARNIFKHASEMSKDELIAWLSDVNGSDSGSAALVSNTLGVTAGDLRNMTDKQFKAVQDDILKYVTDLQAQVDGQTQAVRDTILGFMPSTDDYWKLTDDQKNVVNGFTSSLSNDFLLNPDLFDPDAGEANFSMLANKILEAAKNQDFTDAWREIMSPEIKDLSEADYWDVVRKDIETMAEALGYDNPSEEVIKGIAQGLGFDSFDFTSNKARSDKIISTVSKMAGGLSNDAVQAFKDAFTKEEIDLILNPDSKIIVDGQTIDDVKAQVEDALATEQNGANLQAVIDYTEAVKKMRDATAAAGEYGIGSKSGNIDHFDRPVITWTDEEIEKQRNALSGWVDDVDSLKGTMSTILSAAETFGDVDIGFTPIIKDENGDGKVLNHDTVMDYIEQILGKAEGENGDIDFDLVYKLDAEGLEVDGQHISDIIGHIAKHTEDSIEDVDKLTYQWHLFEEGIYAAKDAEDKLKQSADAANLTIGMYVDKVRAAQFGDFFAMTDKDGKTATTLGNISSELDRVQQAYSTLQSAVEEYNKEGYISVDTLQSVMSLGGQYLQYLFDENGNLALNAEALKNVTYARLEEMKAKAIDNIINTVQNIQNEDQALQYLAPQILKTADAYTQLAESKLLAWQADAITNKGMSEDTANKVVAQGMEQIGNVIKLIDSTKQGIASGYGITGKSAKDAGKAAKDAADKIEDINRQLDDLSKSEALEAVKNKFDNMELAITRTTDALGLLDTTLESQAEDDYIGKLETVTRQLGLAQQKSTLLRNEFAQLSATEATTGDIANELANRMKSTADGIAETQKSIMEYGHNMTEYFMSAMKSVGAMSKSTLERASSLFERNVKTLTEGSLSGFSFTLADSVPQSAYDIQRAENLSIEEEMRRYYDSVENMQKVALDLQYQELLEDNARKRQELLESLSEAQGTLQESANNAVGIQKTTNAITSAAQKADDANKVGEAQAWSGQMQGVMSDLSGWMTENPVKAPGLDTSSWEKMISDAQDYANKVNGIYGNMALGGGIGGIFATGTGTTSTAKGKGSGMGLAEAAMKYLGVPYVRGGTTPQGFDCSGLTYYVARENGISIPRTAADQFAQGRMQGRVVDKNNLQPGDLVFFIGEGGTKTSPNHVGIYIGNDQYIHSPKTGDNVKISKLSSRKDYVGATRIAKYAKGTRDFEAYGKKPNGIAGENRRREILINKTTGEQTVIDTPTLIDTNDYDVVGEKDTAKLLGNRYANGTFGNWTNLALAGGLPHLTVAQIQAILSNTSFQNSPLNKPGAAEGIYNAQQKTGISALATLGMAAFEGGWAKSKVSYAKNNYWGWNHYPANGMTAFEHATTFSPDVGEAFTDYSTRLAKGYASSTINSMARTYSGEGDGSGWATETGKILNQFGNLLKNSGLTDFAPFSGDLTAAVSNIGDTTSAMAQNVQIIAKKDFGTELREFLAGNTASESDVEAVEKDLLEYIKENVQVSEESNKRFVENWNKLQTYQKQQKQYFDSLDRALKGYMGTDQYDALRYKATTAAEDYSSEILNMSANMMLEQYKSSFDMANDAAKQILAYYNKQMAAGADATTLTTIADAYNEAQEIAEEFSDKYVEQMNAQTEFMVSNDNRLLQEVTNSLSWLEDGNEQLEIQQERVSDISERYRIINERIKNYNSQLDELNRKQAVATETIQGMYNDERYSPLLQRYDTSKWLDAEGELTAQFTADLALMNATMAELVPLANQFAQRLSENTKAIHEADDARNSIIDSRNELNKDNIDSQIDKYVEFRERVAEVLEFEKSVNDALVSAQQTYNGFIDSLREEQNTIDAEVAANQHLGGWLSDDTRKQLFNEDDWAEETAEIARLRDEAQSLTDKYKSDISGLTEQEQWKQEGITAEYNKQMEALKGQLSIAKQKLQTAKDQAAIENALKEKDTQLIMGNRIQNVADPDKLYELEKTTQESRLKLLDEETKASEAEDVRNMERISDTLGTQIENINYIVSAINDLPDEEREAFSVLIPSIEELTAAIQSIRKDNQWNIINDDMTESAYTRLPFEKILGYGQLDHEELAEQVLAGINSGLIEDNEYNRRIIYENLANHDNKTLTDPNNAGHDVYGVGEYVGTGKQLLKTHVGSIIAEMLERGRLDKAAQELLSADYLDEYGRQRRPTTVTGDGSVKYGMYPHTVVSGNGAVKYALPDNMVLDDDGNARHLTRPDTVVSGDGDMTYIMPTVTVTETDEAANKKPHSIELSNGTDFTGDGSFVIDGKVYTPVDWNAMLPPIDLMQLERPEYPVYNGDMSGFFKQTYGVTDNSRNFHIEHLEVINPLSADDVINGLLNKTDGLAKITNNQ